MTSEDIRGPGFRARVLTGTVGERRLPSLSEWRAFLLKPSPRASPTEPDAVILKTSPSRTVLWTRLPASGGSWDVVVRAAAATGLTHRLRAAALPSREWRDFARGRALRRQGLPAALPLAVMDMHRPRHESRLVTEYIPDLIDLGHLCLSRLSRLARGDARRARNALIESVVELMVNLQRNGWHHRDLKASNLLLRNWDSTSHSPEVFLVDLEGLRRDWFSRFRRRRQPLIRLAASLVSCPSVTRADEARFLRSYLRKSQGSDGDWRHWFLKLARSAARYRRGSLRRKTGKLDGFEG